MRVSRACYRVSLDVFIGTRSKLGSLGEFDSQALILYYDYKLHIFVQMPNEIYCYVLWNR